MRESYPNPNQLSTLESLNRIGTIREEDITAWNDLPQRFISGRKVDKVPSNSADVATDDNLGDFNYDASFIYLLVDDGGPTWKRVAISNF